MEQDFGLHTTSDRRSLKTPGLRWFQFQSILSPVGRWSYSRRPFFIIERAFSALQRKRVFMLQLGFAGRTYPRMRARLAPRE
jgi:hypothetical protein